MNRVLEPTTTTVEQSAGDGHVMDETRYVTTPAICRQLGISRWTWRRWVRCGMAPAPAPLPGHPRWHRVDVERFQQESRYFRAHRRTDQTVSRRFSVVHDGSVNGGRR